MPSTALPRFLSPNRPASIVGTDKGRSKGLRALSLVAGCGSLFAISGPRMFMQIHILRKGSDCISARTIDCISAGTVDDM